MSKNEALFGPHFGPYRPDARFGREDGPACASSTHSAMDERARGLHLPPGRTRSLLPGNRRSGIRHGCGGMCDGLFGAPR